MKYADQVYSSFLDDKKRNFAVKIGLLDAWVSGYVTGFHKLLSNHYLTAVGEMEITAILYAPYFTNHFSLFSILVVFFLVRV